MSMNVYLWIDFSPFQPIRDARNERRVLNFQISTLRTLKYSYSNFVVISYLL